MISCRVMVTCVILSQVVLHSNSFNNSCNNSSQNNIKHNPGPRFSFLVAETWWLEKHCQASYPSHERIPFTHVLRRRVQHRSTNIYIGVGTVLVRVL
jgi:hypothetical protein